MNPILFAAVLASGMLGNAQKPVEKIDIVAVVGCVKQAAPDGWTLVNATDPVTSNANAPSAKDVAAMPRMGKNEFQLIGVAEFNLPAHRDHIVVVKGLHIKAKPKDRVNVTSVTMVAPSCERPAP